MRKLIVAVILAYFFSLGNIFSAVIPDENSYLQKKSFFEKISFWKKWGKKNKKKTEKMPKTYQQWQKVSQSEPVNQRENPKILPEPNKKLTKVLSPDPFFVKYNNPPGEKEVNLSKIKHDTTENSEGVVNESFDKMAYITYFYYPSYNQISSKLFVLPLDKKQTRIKRVENANILKASRVNNFELNMEEYKEDYYSILTILDWSADSKYLLVKNKVGSSKSGLFRTTLYKVGIDDDGENIDYTKIDFEKEIRNYWEKDSDIALNLYRWDIKPLGFNAENEDEIICYAWGYDKLGNKIFLGAWGASLSGENIYLISEKYFPYEISTHGIIIQYKRP